MQFDKVQTVAESKQRTKLAVIGLGQLGLSLSLCLQEHFDVLGFDKDETRMRCIEKKEVESWDPLITPKLKECKHFQCAPSLQAAVKEVDTVFICVNTIKSSSDVIFHGCHNVADVLEQLSNLQTQADVVICSNLNPGFNDIVCAGICEEKWRKRISYAPLNANYGSIISDLTHLPHLVIGTQHTASADRIKHIFETISVTKPIFIQCTILEVEIIDVAQAALQSIHIAYANAIRQISRKSRVNERRVLDAVFATTRYPSSESQTQFDYGDSMLNYKLDCATDFFSRMQIPFPVMKSSIKYNRSYHKFLADDITKRIANTKKAYIISNPLTADTAARTDILNCPKLVLAQALVHRRVEVVINDRSEAINTIRKWYGSIFNYQITSPD